jgi:predicted nucleic acid-binding protein
MHHDLGNNLVRQIGHLFLFNVNVIGETYLQMLRKFSMSISDDMPLVQIQNIIQEDGVLPNFMNTVLHFNVTLLN